MEPRNRAKGLPKENQRDGFSGKEPATDMLMARKKAISIANRQEAEIFQELVGKEVFLLWNGMGSVFGTLVKAGTDFVKLTDVKYTPTYPDPSRYWEVIRKLKTSDKDAEAAGNSVVPAYNTDPDYVLCIYACPSLILNKSEISTLVPASEHE